MIFSKHKAHRAVTSLLVLTTAFTIIAGYATYALASEKNADVTAQETTASAQSLAGKPTIVYKSDTLKEVSNAAAIAKPDEKFALKMDVSVLNGKKAGCMVGTPMETMVKNFCPDSPISFFSNNADICLALREGKIDYLINNTTQFTFISKEYPEFSYIDQNLMEMHNGFIFKKNDKGARLRDQFNEYLDKIVADGRLDRYSKYWLVPNDWEGLDIPTDGPNGTIHMCTSTVMKPYSFIVDTKFAGFDIELAVDFCKEYGYALDLDDADFAGMLSGITTGKYDVAGGQIAWTKERDGNVYYSNTYTVQESVAIVRTADFVEGAAEVNADEEPTFFESIANSFNKTFVVEDRWQIILKGLCATLVISFFGFVLANIFGAIFCAFTLSKSNVLQTIADIYSRIMQGTPIVVILMILYYVIFGNTDISGIVISIFGFGLSTGAYLSQIFSSSIRSVSVGQTEAALTLGLTKFQAFTGIVLPQAMRSMLSPYFSQFITLMKGTSIVGYIAVTDITKASDIIRSSTYDAFFPLIATAAIYFIISCLLLSLLKRIQKSLAPKRRGAASALQKDEAISEGGENS